MTARHALAVFIAVVGTGAVGAVIVSAVRRVLDWHDRRSYQPPAPLRTEIHRRPTAAAGTTWAQRTAMVGEVLPPVQPVAEVPALSVPQFDAAALGILVGLIARAAQHEAAVQRALYSTPAPIWCRVTAEMELAKAGAAA